MPTIRQQQAAKLLNQYRLVKVATGESVNLITILKESGFTDQTASQATRIIAKKGFQEALAKEEEKTKQIEKGFETRLIAIQDKILEQLETKGMDSATYRDCKDLLGTVGNMIRLAQDKSTANVAIEVQEIKTPEDAKKYLQESGISI